MLEKLHEHVVSELGHSSRTDTIFIVVAVLFNLLVLGINSGASGAAAAGRRDTYASSPLWAAYVVFAVFVVMTILVNAVALGGSWWAAKPGKNC